MKYRQEREMEMSELDLQPLLLLAEKVCCFFLSFSAFGIFSWFFNNMPFIFSTNIFISERSFSKV